MFKNQLPNGLTLSYNVTEGGMVDILGGFPDNSDVYSLSWAIENNEDELIKTKGSAYWAGMANSYYTLDKDKGIAIVYFTQFFPFNDKVSYDFYRLFEKEVYDSLNTK